MLRFRFRTILAIGALLSAISLVAVDFADARPKGSMGSRGSRTQAAPPPTATAPNTAAPINRTATQPTAATRPAAGAPAAQGGFFSRPGLLGGLAAGFLGAGLLGMLFGQGLFSNLGGLASILGFVFQLLLIGGVAWLIVRWWSNRSQTAQPSANRGEPVPAYADGPSQSRMDNAVQPRQGISNMLPNAQQGGALGGLGGLAGGLGSGPGRAPQPSNPAEIEITEEDFNTFERLLGEVLTAYGREDVAALRSLATPEMVSYFSEDLADNASQGVVNQISDVKLLQGDLSESWSEGDVDYATVAMRYQLRDKKVDRTTSRVVEGSDELVEATEVSTYRRARGGNWMLSAIQQTD